MARTVQFLGTSDEVTTCEHCGKRELKGTVALSIDDGEPVYFGATCAARALAMPVKVVRQETARADDAREAAARAERQARWSAQQARWFAYLDARAPEFRGNVFRQLEALGGYAAARRGFTP